MITKDQQLELFNQVTEVWDKKEQLGKLYERFYHLNMFVFDNGKTARKQKPSIRRDIYFDDDTDITRHNKVSIILRPQTVATDDEIKVKYLTEIDQNILDFILYKISQGDCVRVGDKTYVGININEIRSKLKYDSKRIKESLQLLNNYHIYFDSNDFEGVLPQVLFDGVIIGKRGRRSLNSGIENRTLIGLTPALIDFVMNHKSIIINYEKMFELSRVAKILFKRLCFSNHIDQTNKPQVIELAQNETVCSLLAKYGISYTRATKAKFFNEIETALNELKKADILKHYEITDYKKRYNVITDYKIRFILTKSFSLEFISQQLNKEKLENMVLQKQLSHKK